MIRIKAYLESLGRTARTVIIALAVVFVSAGIAQAATTISTNILTNGTLGATGVSTFGGTASTTISVAGVLTTPASAVALFLGGASTTQFTLLSGDTIKNASASSTVISGVVQATGGVLAQASSTVVGNFTTTGNVAVTGTLDVTGATTLASTTATGFKVGQTGTRLTRATAGYCVTDAAAITASTTTMLTCTPSGGTGILTASDRVFVTATSSLPGRIHLSAASSTAAGTIQVNAFNTGIDAGTVGSAAYAFNFWAFQ